jgi:hypothetical protein
LTNGGCKLVNDQPSFFLGSISRPNNLDHADDPGCFRCHDANQTTPNKKPSHRIVTIAANRWPLKKPCPSY